MMRTASLFLISIFIISGVFAQNSHDHSGMSQQMGQPQNMSGMHDQMMKDMQADLDAMHSTLQKMKDQLGKIIDQSAKEQLQLNIEMWQALIDNMDKHMAMMKQMMGSGHGMMMHGNQPARK